MTYRDAANRIIGIKRALGLYNLIRDDNKKALDMAYELLDREARKMEQAEVAYDICETCTNPE